MEKKTPTVFKYFNYLLQCKKTEKTNDPFLRKSSTNGQMEYWMARQTDRQTVIL